MVYYDDMYGGLLEGDGNNGSGGSGSDLVGGYGMVIAGGTASKARYLPVQTVSGSSVTLTAGGYFRINATNIPVTFNTETIPEGSAGLEGHAEIFVAGTGYVVEGANVTLVDPLEPDAVNNCTLRFYGGLCRVSVEDHAAGYIVKSPTGTTSGTLYYGLGTASEAYIAVDAALNGTTLDLGGVVTSAGEKHVVGNGYTETTLTGAIDCSTNKVTVANLALQDVGITGGTLTLGDAFIPSGSTVAVSGGGLAVEKVTGAGSDSVIDLSGGGAIALMTTDQRAYMSGVTVANGSRTFGGAIQVSNGLATFDNCVFSGCKGEIGAVAHITGGRAAYVNYFNVCVFEDNGTGNTADVTIYNRSVVFDGCIFNKTVNGSDGSRAFALTGDSITVSTTVSNCQIAKNIVFTSAGIIDFSGSNSLVGKVAGGTGTVNVTSGAILDLTGNTNAVPIAPGAGVIVEGGCTVINSAGASVSIAGGTYTQINNDGTTE